MSISADLQKKILPLVVTNFVDVVSLKSNSPVVESRRLYRVADALITNSKVHFTVIDKNFILQKGLNEVAVERAPKNVLEVMPNTDQWRSDDLGEIVRTTTPFDVVKAMRDLNTPWPDYIQKLADDSGQKSEALIDIFLSQLVNCPRQELNNHAIILTNTGTGKTETYRRLTGSVPATDMTLPGLMGSVAVKDNYSRIVGALDGSGMIAFDEFPEYDYTVVEKLLNYLENGETGRNLVRNIRCVGTKSVTFLGNYGHFSAKDFKSSLVGLATKRALARVGRRFAHILYERMPEVSHPPTKFNVFEARTLVNYSLARVDLKVKRLYRRLGSWFYKPDKEYTQAIDELKHNFEDSPELYSFLSGCSLHTHRLRSAALKRAIIEHLDELVLSRGYAQVFDDSIGEDVDEFYEKFKFYNLRSFENILEPKKAEFIKMRRQGLAGEKIRDSLQISQKLYHKWLVELVRADSKRFGV